MNESDYVTFTQAREMLGGASKDRLRRIIQREGWTVYDSTRDAREKWLLRAEVQAYLVPRPTKPRSGECSADD
jgi:hypothetical protein